MSEEEEYTEVEVVQRSGDEVLFKRGWRAGGTPKYEEWVEFSDGTQIEIDRTNLRHRIEEEAFVKLWEKTGGFPVEAGSEWIPVEVATEGQAAIAVYLTIVAQLSREEITERMGVGEGTVRKYISGVARGDRLEEK